MELLVLFYFFLLFLLYKINLLTLYHVTTLDFWMKNYYECISGASNQIQLSMYLMY